MAKTIFDLVTAPHLATYWQEIGNNVTNLTEELFPASKQLGINLKWIKGSKGRPVVLKASAFDVSAVPRARIGISAIQSEMPYFKESMYIDEELRQQLNIVMSSGKQEFIDSVIGRIFDDEMRLLSGAAVRREQMRMMALTTGMISVVSNGQNYEYDYGITHKANSIVPWSDPASEPLEDLRLAKETIQAETGEVLARAMCDGISWKHLKKHPVIRQSVFVNTPDTRALLSDSMVKRFLADELGLEVIVNDNLYNEENGTSVRFMPENTFVLFPAGPLGNMWFGTTPAESDLATSNVANVSIVDTGVAVTTIQKPDPVQVETIVSQICLPSLERADSIYILDTNPA